MRPRLLDLANGSQAMLDEDDLHLVQGHSLYLSPQGYVLFSTNATGPVLVHRLVCPSPPGMHVDHIDGDKLNNTRANLRSVTPQVNQANRKRLNRNNRSGTRGVAETSQSGLHPWRAQITVNRRNIHLGLFSTRDAAIAARRAAELAYFGEECP